MKADISPLVGSGTLLFSGYDDDYIKINNQRYGSGLSLHEGRLSTPWGPERLRELKPEHLSGFIDDAPEILLIGTGRLTSFPCPAVLDYLEEHHVAFECMDSRAAARTYNILVGEGRRVSVAMLLPSARN